MDNRGKMGLFSCVALIIGACIGSAIFSISGITVWYAGPSAILSWMLAALIYGLYGGVVSKLAGMFPRSGGIYLFPSRAIGGRPGIALGFFSGWGYIVSTIIAIAFSAIYLGIFLQAGFPSLDARLVSIAALLLSLALLLVRSRRSQLLQNSLVIIFLAIILFFCLKVFGGGHYDAANYIPFFKTGSKGPWGFLAAVPLAMVAYGGCISIAFLASEVRNPGRNVGLSLFIGLGIVALVYAGLVTAIVGTVPYSVLQDNEALRFVPLFASVSHGSLTAFPWITKLISIGGTLALFVSITAMMRVNCRAVQAISREGLFPMRLARTSASGAAVRPLVLMTAVCCGLCLIPGRAEMMISLGAVLNIISMTITCISLIAARRRAGWLAPLAILLFWICYIPDILNGSAAMWLFTLAVYALGAVVYLCFRKRAWRRIGGTVIHGKGKGHLHRMPTANLYMFSGSTLPEYGVWATRVFLDGKAYFGVTNVGLRPSVDQSDTPSVETLIIDFDGDLYGRELWLEFVSYIRPTIKFDSLDDLRTQIDSDIQAAFAAFR